MVDSCYCKVLFWLLIFHFLLLSLSCQMAFECKSIFSSWCDSTTAMHTFICALFFWWGYLHQHRLLILYVLTCIPIFTDMHSVSHSLVYIFFSFFRTCVPFMHFYLNLSVCACVWEWESEASNWESPLYTQPHHKCVIILLWILLYCIHSKYCPSDWNPCEAALLQYTFMCSIESCYFSSVSFAISNGIFIWPIFRFQFNDRQFRKHGSLHADFQKSLMKFYLGMRRWMSKIIS